MTDISLVEDFYRLRRQADFQAALARLSGRPVDLLEYESVRRWLGADSLPPRVLKEIPLSAIVGSVGRPRDFTRDFKPRSDADVDRWTRVKAGALDLQGLPPIEVYQVGETYFVRDGHHRVSVARDLGLDVIAAYVTEVRTKVPVTRDMDLDDLARQARYVGFLERTGLDTLRPGANFAASDAEVYDALERHIGLHRHALSVEQSRDVTYTEAASDWYDRVYLPVTQMIDAEGAPVRFSSRTSADAYLWVSGYRALLDEQLDWAVETGDEREDATSGTGAPARPASERLRERLLRIGIPPKPGDWRRAQILAKAGQSLAQDFHLFTTLLVPVSGQKAGWQALSLALEVAQRERGRVLGLHVVGSDAEKKSPPATAVRDEFEWRCREAGVMGRLAIESGAISDHVCERSGWADLTVLRLAYPPPKARLARLNSGMRALLRCCRSPLLVTPGRPAVTFDRLLLAYDGSPRADHALFIAAYLAQRWGSRLAVVSVGDHEQDAQNVAGRGKAQLEQLGVGALEITMTGPVADAILAAAEEQHMGLIVVGGYGHAPVLEMALGSTVDDLLRRSFLPTLICP